MPPREAVKPEPSALAVCAGGDIGPVVAGVLNEHKLPKEFAMKVLEGLKWQQRYVSRLGCIKGCLDYLGVDVAMPWLYGGTGHAFVINVVENAHVSGPFAWDWSMIHDLGPNLGYRVTGFFARKRDAGDSYGQKQREAWDFVRASVDRGLPCYGWELHPWIPDYYVITGYDGEGYHYSGWRSGGPLPWQKLGEGDVQQVEVYRIEPCQPAPDGKAVADALATVLERAKRPDGWTLDPGSTSGPAAFDRWAAVVEEGAALRDDHAYNAATWHECRQMAVEFLKEARNRLAGRCDDAFDEAGAHYTVVRDRLKAVADLHPMPTSGWDTETKVQSPEVAALLREAGAAERKGLECLKRIAAAL
jgi:hypothetical protein